jgi:hypothetical protein
MKFRICLLSFVFSALSAGAWAQCSSPNLKPVWDAGKNQFRCVGQSNSGSPAKDESVQPVGDKEFCTSARENLQAACPASNEGKACRNQAKSIYNACYKRAKSESDSQRGSLDPGSAAGKTDSATCMTTFQQQQQACSSRRMPPPSPGQMAPPDTCLQDALAAQSRCLANSR